MLLIQREKLMYRALAGLDLDGSQLPVQLQQTKCKLFLTLRLQVSRLRWILGVLASCHSRLLSSPNKEQVPGHMDSLEPEVAHSPLSVPPRRWQLSGALAVLGLSLESMSSAWSWSISQIEVEKPRQGVGQRLER